MKCVIFITILAFYTVHGLKTIQKGYFNTISVEPIEYGADRNYYNAGIRKSIICKGGDKNQKVEWVDPSGKVVPRVSTNRVFVQEHFVPSYRARVPAAVLVFTHATVEDSGVWECRAGGKKRELSLCIIDPVEFVDTPTEVTMDLGRSITLTCQARGGPEPTLEWYRNGEIVVEDSASHKYVVTTKFNSQGFEGLLTIRSLEREDSGIYTCTAIQASPHDEDCIASKSTNITLNINYAPVFSDGNDTNVVFVKENENAELTCSVEAYPEPTYRWFKEVGSDLSEIPQSEIRVAEDGSKAVIILKVEKSLFGQRFVCRATNQYGNVDKVFAIQKLEKPQPPIELTINNSSYNSVQLRVTWEEEAFYQVAGVEIQYVQTNGLKRKGNSDWRKASEIEVKSEEFDAIESENSVALITLPNLEEDTSYWLRIRAINEAGWSSWSAPIKAATELKPEVEDAEESPIQMKSESHDSLARLYGLLFAGGVLVIAFGSMFIVRLV
ncbi:neural cell adhesion molecule 1 [Pieris rapae]|uniref:neural cell adhesion molecule 1 n=1 Tax=Pieris rapae TaxID=64459 RepID=UPI001E28130E|nr:neural cell adhesion molecule 1 [Pieris rapae]